MNLDHIPKKYRSLVFKALAGKLSPRKAIKVKCYDCMGFEDVRKRIMACSVKTCPLYTHRPFQEGLNESK